MKLRLSDPGPQPEAHWQAARRRHRARRLSSTVIRTLQPVASREPSPPSCELGTADPDGEFIANLNQSDSATAAGSALWPDRPVRGPLRPDRHGLHWEAATACCATCACRPGWPGPCWPGIRVGHRCKGSSALCRAAMPRAYKGAASEKTSNKSS